MASGTRPAAPVSRMGGHPLPQQSPQLTCLMRRSWYHAHLLQNSPKADALLQCLARALFTSYSKHPYLVLMGYGDQEASQLRLQNVGSHAARDPQNVALVPPAYYQVFKVLQKILPQVNSRAIYFALSQNVLSECSNNIIISCQPEAQLGNTDVSD